MYFEIHLQNISLPKIQYFCQGQTHKFLCPFFVDDILITFYMEYSRNKLVLVVIFIILLQAQSFVRQNHKKPSLQRRRLVESVDTLTNSAGALDQLAQQPEMFASGLLDGFAHTFSSRLVGVLAGNVAAVFVLKLITDWIWRTARTKYEDLLNSITKPFQASPRSKNGDLATSINNMGVESEAALPPSAYFTLILCILIDFGGDASYLLPGVGEAEDAAWAPLSAFLLSNIFGSNVVTTLDFVKEALPGTDILPVAVIAWLLKYRFPDSGASKYLGLSSDNKKKE